MNYMGQPSTLWIAQTIYSSLFFPDKQSQNSEYEAHLSGFSK